MTSYAAKQYGYGDYYFTPTVDGKIIQELPSKGFSEGKFSKVPVIADREAYEGKPSPDSILSKLLATCLLTISRIVLYQFHNQQ